MAKSFFLSAKPTELKSHTDYITRWFRELQHYGFIVMTTRGCLGVDGKGKAPHWRLTELDHNGKPPSRDFARWNGVPFLEKKQKPVPLKWDAPSHKSGTLPSRKSGTPARESVPQKRDISEPQVSRKNGTDLDSSSHLSLQMDAARACADFDLTDEITNEQR
jgi:hypothetical protein